MPIVRRNVCTTERDDCAATYITWTLMYARGAKNAEI